jgi:hypothetical protein
VSRNFGLRQRDAAERISVGELLEVEDEEECDYDNDDGEFKVAPNVRPGASGEFPMDHWGRVCASGQWEFFPSIVLVGFGESAAEMTFPDVCKWKGRLIVIENATAGNVNHRETVLKPFLFDPFSDAGEILRGWIRQVQKHWHKFMLVCTTGDWTEQIVQQIGDKKHVVRIALVRGVEEGCLPDARWMLEQSDEEVVARAVKHSHNFANALVGGKGLLTEEEKDSEGDYKCETTANQDVLGGVLSRMDEAALFVGCVK